ncbi:MAG: signal peptide peptidase SppA [Candidatus Cloacimonadota bacterium]|nr:MAG: signal peptide peptidase SppA [Candidatus Cloacimonadota bacterium]
MLRKNNLTYFITICWMLLLANLYALQQPISFSSHLNDFYYNPALLSADKDNGIAVQTSFSDNDDFNIYLRSSSSISFAYLNNDKKYFIGNGSRIFKNFYLGTGLEFKKHKKTIKKIGIIYRPFDVSSFGIVAQGVNWKPDLTTEIAIRPLFFIRKYSSYLNLFFQQPISYDYEKDKYQDDDFIIGGQVEPINGFQIEASYINDKDRTYQIGCKINFSQFGTAFISERTSDNHSEYNITEFSERKKRSIFSIGKHTAKITISGNISQEYEGFSIFGHKSITDFEIIEQIDKAIKDKSINKIFIEIKLFTCNYASLEEIRNKLLKFKEQGGEIICYFEQTGRGGYLLASTADTIIMPESGMLNITGFYAETPFYKRLLEKIGIKIDVFKIGKYKSADEHFTQEEFTEPAYEDYRKLFDSYYETYIEEIAEARKIIRGTDALKEAIDNGPFTAEEALKYNLIDKIGYKKDAEELYKSKSTVKVTKGTVNLKNVYFKNYHWVEAPKIMVINAIGTIITGKSQKNPFSIPFLGRKFFGSDTFSEMIEKGKKDRNVKAIVVRINSPGGSALASDLMWHKIYQLNKEKPVIISMNGVAASGGYYIASAGTKIFADKMTITGSIGVISMRPNFSGLYSKLGINKQVIRHGKNSGMFHTCENLTDDETAKFNKLTKDWYNLFTKRVSCGRNGLTQNEVDSLGQGKVYIAREAEKCGLIDDIGGLYDAIEFARKIAGLDDYYEITFCPEPKQLFKGLTDIIDSRSIFYIPDFGDMIFHSDIDEDILKD